MAQSEKKEAVPYGLTEECEKDKEVKKKILIDLALTEISEISEYEDLRKIAKAIKDGDTLSASIISGGLTNYSYKIFLENDPETALYAKIAFPYSLWNPDRSATYDVSRADNEFRIMRRFAQYVGDGAPVAKAYFCKDVDEMKIFVTEWATSNEQWGNQFIDGKVDTRIIPKVAETIIELHLAPFDEEFPTDFNDNVRPCVLSLFPQAKQIVANRIQEETPADACVAYMKELGQEKIDLMLDNMETSFMTRECINHNDFHLFNIIVENKNDDEKFGEKGEFIIVDWEMAMAGPHGKDAGIFCMWPITCALAHAAHGSKETALHLLETAVQFLDEYFKLMAEKGGKDDASIVKMYRTSLGFCSQYLVIALYMLGLLLNLIPKEELTKDMLLKARGSLGLVGMKLMEYGFGDKETGLGIEELRERLKEIVITEIDLLVDAASKYGRPRLASSVRASGRHVSDAHLMDHVSYRHFLPEILDDLDEE